MFIDELACEVPAGAIEGGWVDALETYGCRDIARAGMPSRNLNPDLQLKVHRSGWSWVGIKTLIRM